MLFLSCVVVCLAAAAQSLPPDKGSPHIIQRQKRSIDSYDLAFKDRLPKAVVPTGYHLMLEPYLEYGFFKGDVRINITWLRDSEIIPVHIAAIFAEVGHHLDFWWRGDLALKVDTANVSIEYAEYPTPSLNTSIVKFYLDKKVKAGSKGYIVVSFYNGKVDTNSSGTFFKTLYKEQDCERIVAATHLVGPNSARRLFPCFDEPEYKTPFELSVLRPKNMVALSNMPVARTEVFGDAVWDHFEPTPPMSTFSLGLVIAALELLPNSSRYKDDIGNDLELRVWGRAEFLKSLQGLNHNLTNWFHEIAHYLNVPLPLRKLDIVALPGYSLDYDDQEREFYFGIIMLRESDLEYISYTLRAGIARQWLGALTTPVFSSDVQLNEALVTYIADVTYFKLQCESGKHEVDACPRQDTYKYTFYYEAAKSFPSQAVMKYKTKMLLNMIVYIIGENNFKTVLRIFLESHKFKTFSDDDFWQALGEKAKAERKIAEDVNMKQVAQSWKEKDRIPLITVTRNYDKKEAVVTQSVFVRERPHNVSNANMTWWIPLVVIRQDNLDFHNTTIQDWMKNEKQVILGDMPSNDKFILVNPEELGPYSVNYDRENWRLISLFLQGNNRDAIPPLDRAKLLHDSWNLAYAGELSFAVVFEMVQMLHKEKDPSVWQPFFIMLDHLNRQLTPCLHAKWKVYTQVMLVPLYEELQDGHDHGFLPIQKDQLKSLRESLLKSVKIQLCIAGYKPCIQKAQEKYRKWMTLENPDEDYHVIGLSFGEYGMVLQHGTMEEWEFGFQRVINSASSSMSPEEKYDFFRSVVGISDETKITRMLNLILLEDIGNFTEKNISLMFIMMTGSSEAPIILFKFLQENWDILKEKYQNSTELWNQMIYTATSRFTTRDGLDLVAGLYHRHKGEFGSATAVIENSMKKNKEEAAWSERSLPIIEQELDKVLNAEASLTLVAPVCSQYPGALERGQNGIQVEY